MIMAAPRKAIGKPVPQTAPAKGGYKFATLKREAAKKSAERDPRPEIEPFVITDVEPPIVITAPDTVERQLDLAEMIGPDGTFHVNNSKAMLRALCGNQFGRVWMLVKDDKDPDLVIGVVQAILTHFADVLTDMNEAGELPGGSEDS